MGSDAAKREGYAGRAGAPRAACAGWLVAAAMLFPAGVVEAREPGLFRKVAASPDLVVVEADEARLAATSVAGGRVIVADFPLLGTRAVDLELTPFRVTGPGTRFVLGRRGAADEPLDFDPSRVLLFRGRAIGHPGSHVYLAVAGVRTTGTIDLGPGGERFHVATRDRDGRPLGGSRLSVFGAGGPASLPPDVPSCGTGGGQPDVGPLAPPSIRGTGSIGVGLRQLQLAVETDHEFFRLFDDAEAAATYLVQLYGQVSDIYLRDVGTRVELSYVRLWDAADDLFNDVDPSPLPAFRSYWNANMGAVTRDAAQLLSGRRDYPFGGQAYLSALCGSAGYSVVGYALGYFPDPLRPSPYHYDIHVTAHELGHNAGTGHTHDSPNFVDTCANPATSPQRGTIMSYCGQTWSGGNANGELYFHTRIRQNMEAHIGNASCIADDCNGNGVPDAADLSGGASDDADGNGIPDECEDCNGNGVLDDLDLALGTSLDVNEDGIPDDCQPDCNGNGAPDDRDIAAGSSLDLHGNLVPDECELDCDGDGTSDYSEIQDDMTLDRDRSAALDACEDCDDDGTPDLEALGGAHRAWVASGLAGSALREFHGDVGVLTRLSATTIDQGQDVIVTPDGRVLVSTAGGDRVRAFDLAGADLGDLVAPGAGGLVDPAGLVWHPSGSLLVASSGGDSVLEYDATDGTYLGPFVPAGSGGLAAPFGMTLGPQGNLFVTSGAGEVLEFDGADGTFVRVLVGAADNGGLAEPRGLVFKPDGNLLVASYGTNEVLEFDGPTGEPLGKWARVGTATVLTQVSPWGLRIGPNGNVFVARTGGDFGSGAEEAHEHHHEIDGLHDEILARVQDLHLTNAQIYEYDVRTGDFLRTYVGGNDHGLLFPTGFDFVPGDGVDCNVDFAPDACDVALGTSEDADLDGIPDECQVDCNGNGVPDRLDRIPFGASRDCNFNGVPDECDVASGSSRDCDEDGVPDECDVRDDLEAATGWTVGAPGDQATGGIWTRVDPVGTAAQPEKDHTPLGSFCFVTGQGTPGGADGAADVDGGATTLLSPPFDLAGDPDARIGYWRWFSNDTGSNPGQDVLTIDVSGDGESWVNVEVVGPGGPEASGGWHYHGFRVADFVTPGDAVRLRFVAADAGAGSIVEAAVDDVRVVAACCDADVDCGDALECTSSACDVPAGRCLHVPDAGTCSIEGACFEDGASNPANDCEACDETSPTGWTPDPPGDVAGLSIDAARVLTWDALGATVVYDVAGGSTLDLHAAGGVLDATCLADDVAASSWDDPRPDPAPGDGYYYLVRSQKSCGPGSYGEASSGAERVPAAGCP